MERFELRRHARPEDLEALDSCGSLRSSVRLLDVSGSARGSARLHGSPPKALSSAPSLASIFDRTLDTTLHDDFALSSNGSDSSVEDFVFALGRKPPEPAAPPPAAPALAPLPNDAVEKAFLDLVRARVRGALDTGRWI